MYSWLPQPALYLAITLVTFLQAEDLLCPATSHEQAAVFALADFLEAVAFGAAALVVTFLTVFFVAGIFFPFLINKVLLPH